MDTGALQDRIQNALSQAVKNADASRRELHRMLKDMDERRSRSWNILARDGWYPEPTWWDGLQDHVAEGLDRPSPDKWRADLCKWLESKLSEFEADLVTAHPARRRFLEAVFRAHRAGDYMLSIPLALAQADGLCSEFFGVQLQARDRNTQQPRLATTFEQAPDFIQLALDPLLRVHPVAYNQTERTGQSGELFNRHTILHGESLAYDTRENACRSISYLRYIGWVTGCSQKWPA